MFARRALPLLLLCACAAPSVPAATPKAAVESEDPSAAPLILERASGTPELAGHCPVTLLLEERIAPGQRRLQVRYRADVYQLADDAAQRLFLAEPERFVPAFGGNDAVLRVEPGRRVAGRVEHFAVFRGRTYLFASAQSRASFVASPEKFAEPAP